MSRVGWIASTEGTVALAAATAKTVLSVISPSAKVVTAVKIQVNFDGVTATAASVLIEVCRSSQGAAGTSSSVTPRRKRGAATATVGATAAKNFTVEPTTITLIEDYAVDPYKGLILKEDALGRESEIVNGEAFLLRLTAPATVNCRAFIEFEEG